MAIYQKIQHLFKSLPAEINEIPEPFNVSHYPSLNGFRAVSIIIVIFFHLGLSGNYFYRIIFNGSVGVDVFFVISGFLITTLLVKEKAQTGTINLKNFYIRRILRILPAAYLYLTLMVILNYFFHLNINPLYFGAAFLFIANFEFTNQFKSSFISHYWSLSVEEQFYLLFPVVLKKNFKYFVFFICFIVFILPFVINIQFLVPSINHGIYLAFTHYFLKFQGIAVGCLFAILCLKGYINSSRFQKYNIMFLKVIITLLIFYCNHTGAVTVVSIYTNLIISILIALLLVLNLFYTNDWFYKFLNFNIISKIGVLSYSIYIWHLLIINPTFLPKFINGYPQNLFFIITIALLSYYLWEQKFLKLKNRMFRHRSK